MAHEEEEIERKRDIVHLMEILAVLRHQLGKPDTDKPACLALIGTAFKAMEGQY